MEKRKAMGVSKCQGFGVVVVVVEVALSDGC